LESLNVWDDLEKVKEYQKIKKELKEFDNLKEKLELLKLELEIGEIKSFEKDLEEIEKILKAKEILIFLSEKYDKEDAILFFQSGAGGKDAEDFCAILLRMYQRFCERKGFNFEILDIVFGEEGVESRIGIKSSICEVSGNFAFGILKGESGIHRLVRISPFSAQGLRHTSFVLVEVLPKIQEQDLPIKSSDLEIETFKSSGAGGQYVNKRMTAIRIKHLPTGIVVTCQTERSLQQNKEKALEILRTKLYHLQKEKKEKELERVKGEKRKIEFGKQIRSYVLHPYKLVKDLRTKVETTQVEEVFDGNLDEFIEAEIKMEVKVSPTDCKGKR
jgi:peptide chain release factor 2